MFTGLVNSILATMGITGEEAGQMARRVVDSVNSVDARLAKIEAALGIETEKETTNELDGTSSE